MAVVTRCSNIDLWKINSQFPIKWHLARILWLMKLSYKTLFIIIIAECCLTSVLGGQIATISPIIEWILTVILCIPIWLLCFIASKDQKICKFLNIAAFVWTWFIPICIIVVSFLAIFQMDPSDLLTLYSLKSGGNLCWPKNNG